MDETKSSSRDKSMEPDEEIEGPPAPEPEPQSVVVEPKTSVDREIEELEARLPPIDKTALPRWRKDQAREV